MRQSRKYSEEFKHDAVEKAMDSDNKKETANELDVPLATLNTWLAKAKYAPSESNTLTVAKPKMKKDRSPDAKLMAELEEEREVSASLDQNLDRALKQVDALKTTLKLFLFSE